MSAKLNAAETLTMRSEGKEEQKKEIRPAVIGDLQEQRFHSLVEARTRLKVVEDTEATYIGSLLSSKPKGRRKRRWYIIGS